MVAVHVYRSVGREWWLWTIRRASYYHTIRATGAVDEGVVEDSHARDVTLETTVCVGADDHRETWRTGMATHGRAVDERVVGYQQSPSGHDRTHGGISRCLHDGVVDNCDVNAPLFKVYRLPLRIRQSGVS